MSYQGMSALYKEFSETPFTIFAFPANQFGHQEPLSNSWIHDFVRGNGTHKCGLKYCDWKGYFPYPLLAKTTVKPSWCTKDPTVSCTSSSSDCCSKNMGVWQWLKSVHGDVPKWNFASKTLFDKCGRPAYYVNDETLDPAKLAPQIRQLLNKDC
ncbi:hypothetical protein PTSG_00411 [Salpingoeca rosetta]|uniref:Glutathione peroxidase n=1 Tax=Salpingoeca rosetta (strain ATCC 50818 / BSB-021) TaxID=946362 RepID=F2TWE5_SALR5|nr:uncharacterized protein PTSG_00411 [Salpingoeca rosetta]EGD72391.1 hypothetical protein PTSG_00411 [Salpingoeca rosetta]|eukprot:XP_004998960.1 hypothetical protein PTSG_00411 [Salpingoeca rosetta]